MFAMPTTVRLRVDKILDERQMTQADLVELTKLDKNTVSAITRNAYSRIGLETIAVLCDALKVEPGELFARQVLEAT